ncbi:MAG: hypothetical protein GY839_03805 [candidate division Zixibacteria bacterium]|nr:hypothetical protein [candidate division Zixibacteria bacterium]
MSKHLQILLKPAFLIALALLLLNDHLLKAAYPGWLTGKLSDFAGLFVMAVFVYAVIDVITNRSGAAKSKKSILLIHAVVGTAFIIWKTAPVEIMFAEINRFVSIPLPSRVKDISDLMALSILPLSYLYITRYKRPPLKSIRHLKLGKAATIGILIITGLAIIATSPGRRYDIKPNITIETNREYAEILTLFEQVLIDNEIEIKDQHAVTDTSYLYKIDFKRKVPPDSKYDPDFDRWYVSFITLVYSSADKTLSVESIYGWVTYDFPEDKQLSKLYMAKIIEPFLNKIQAETEE